MNILMEFRKIKGTGFTTVFLCGGILTSLVPALNMTFRSALYTSLANPPLQILLDANWQMMALLNVLLVVSGACILYHTEYADNAIQKMNTLPYRESSMFIGKFLLTLSMCILIMLMEAVSLLFCCLRWYPGTHNLLPELCKVFGSHFLWLLPAVVLSLLISAACKNMWISLGIGVLCVFTATMLPAKESVLALFPFSLSFQSLPGTTTGRAISFSLGALIEIVLILAAALIFFKQRRDMA